MAIRHALLGMLIIITLFLTMVCVNGVTCPPGDLTKDCQVNMGDLVLLAQHWLEGHGSLADIDGNGVGQSDFGVVSANWLRREYPLVINEYMIANNTTIRDPDDPAEEYPDWIELYNYGDTPIDIADCWITDNLHDPTTWQIPSGHPEITTIQPGAFVILWADNDSSQGPLHLDFAIKAGEDIGLFKPDGNTLIDGFAVESLSADHSFGRIPDGSDSWQIFSIANGNPPTPGESNTSPTDEDNIVINEIMYHPSSENDLDEYIELFNKGDHAVHIEHWRIAEGVDFTFPDVTISVGGFVILAADPARFAATYPEVTAPVVGPWTGILRDSGEEILLVNSKGRYIDYIAYSDEGEWAKRYLGPLDYSHRGWLWSDAHDGLGETLELIDPEMPNEYGRNWAASTTGRGTPGAVNSVYTDEIAPLIAEAEHSPIIPHSTDVVTVRACVIDELTTGLTVNLRWRRDQSAYTSSAYPTYNAASYTVVAMAPTDGGFFSATIPAQADKAVIEFFIEAIDSGGKTRTFPAPSDVDGTPQQVTNLLYQVNNAYDPAALWVAGAMPKYYVVMTESERGRLADIGDNEDSTEEYNSDAQMNATFISVDGSDGVQCRYNAGIRNRGNRSRYDPPMNYRVNLRHDQPWKHISAINLNSKYPHLQVLGSAMFRLAGIPGMETRPVTLFVNAVNPAASDSGRTYGCYACVEAYNGDWADNHFPDDAGGNLYRCTYDERHGYRTNADLSYQGTNPAGYFENYVKQTNEEEYDYSDLFLLTRILNDPTITDGEYVSTVNTVANVDRWARYLAVDTLLGNQEGGLHSGSGDDYAMYRGAIDPRFWLLPHDLDTVFGQGDHSYSGARDDNIFEYEEITGLRRLMTNPDFLFLYFRHIDELSRTLLAPANFNPLADRLLGYWVPDSEINGVQGIKQFVVDRTNAILNGPTPQIPRLSLTASGSTISTNGVFALMGTFNPITTRSIRVNGQPVNDSDWNQKTGTWSYGNGTVGTIELIVPRGSTWKYLDDGSDQKSPADGILWYGNENYDDSFWHPESPAELGYGDRSDGRPEATEISYGPSSSQKYITYYFRKWFTVADATKYSTLKVRVVRDDGIAVYLNGTRIVLDRIQEGFNYKTEADEPAVSGSGEYTFYEFSVDRALLRTGPNLVAAEVHQNSPSSTDVSFDMELEGVVPASGGAGRLSPGMNRILIQAFDGPAGNGNEVDRTSLDIQYDTGSAKPISGILAADPVDSKILKVATSDRYLPGYPILIRVELIGEDGKPRRDIWDATATISVQDNPAISLSASEIHLSNGLGTALVTVDGNGDFAIEVTCENQTAIKNLTQLHSASMTTVSGTLSGSQTWAGIIHITGGDFTIPAGATLTLSPGTMILIDGAASGDAGLDVDVLGSIQSLGSPDSPVTFGAFIPGQNFGELHFSNAMASLFRYTDIHQGGRSPGVGHSGTGPTIRVSGSTIVFENCGITHNAGKLMHATSGSDLTFRGCVFTRCVMGPEISGTALLFEDGWITEMRSDDDADGIYVSAQSSGQSCILRRSVAAGFDDDAIDLLGPTILVEDCILRDSKDKGLSMYGGTTTIRRCLIVETNKAPEDPTVSAVAAKAFEGESAAIHIDRSTIVATRTAGITDYGIQSHNKTGVSAGSIVWNVTNSIIDATDPVNTQAPYLDSDVHIDYSDVYGEVWPGTGNLNLDPMFVDRVAHNYHLASGSPCIDAGDPARTDPDASRMDQGYYVFGSDAETPGDTATWRAASGPYRVTGNLTIPAGVTLSIEAGTSVFVDPGVTIRVEGSLIAEGEPFKPIRICKTPGTTGAWGGILFADSTMNNRIRYAIIEQARSTNGMVNLSGSKALFENVEFGYTGTETQAPLRRVHILNSSAIVRNCVFTDVCKAGQAPTNNTSEHIWGAGILAGGEVLLEGNTFGRTPGHNDAFDFDSQPGQIEIPCIRNNRFLGGGDDALDLETDAYIEGNVFENYIKDAYNTDPQESNVVSAGAGKRYWMARNVFVNCGHAVQVKDGAFLTFVNNTVVNASISAIYFGAPPAGKGDGCDIDGCIFFNTPTVLPLADVGTVRVTLNRSIVPAAYLSLGTGNVNADPMFGNAAAGDYHLRPGSPATGTGPAGVDMGAMIDAGVIILSGPNTPTYSNAAQFTFYGAGIVAYRYRLDDGEFSAEQIITQALTFADLSEGPHTLEVIGRTYGGHWQQIPSVWEWTVDPAYGRILIHEVMANPYRGYSDWIELYNDSAVPVNLKGYSLSDSLDNPSRFVFPNDTPIGSGRYLQVFSEPPGIAGAIVFGFGLSRDGDDVFLFNPLGLEMDRLRFGPQPVALSIGRIGRDRQWKLTTPTPLGANQPAVTGNVTKLRINEWLARGAMMGDDFIELYNCDRLPVELTGLALTDNLITQPRKSVFGPLSFIDGFGFIAVRADKQNDPGHVNFRLSSEQEIISLTDVDGTELDKVLYHHQTTDISQGLVPDGESALAFFAEPTPGSRNVLTVVINEVLAHAHAETPDWIELYNSGADPVMIGGWYLSDDQAQWDKYRIPDNTILLSGEYKVFYEDQTFGNGDDPGCRAPFALSENGDAVYLTAMADGQRTGYQVWEDFGASPTGMAFGRYRISTGMWHFPLMSENTPNDINATPWIGPVVISEIFYNPGVSQDQEFVELYNPTDHPVDLKGYDFETKEWLSWRFTEGIEYTFGLNVTIPSHGYLILAKNPLAFTARFGAMPANVTVYGPYDGQLNNGGERLELSLPGDEQDGRRYTITAERVDYGNAGRWADADGNGKSLTRIHTTGYPNDPTNWKATTPTPGQ